MEQINKLTSESILEEEVFNEIFKQEDEIYKARFDIDASGQGKKSLE